MISKILEQFKNKFLPLPQYFLTPKRFMIECQKQSMNGLYRHNSHFGGSVGYMLNQIPQPEYLPSSGWETMSAYETATKKMRHTALEVDCVVDGFIAEYGVADGTSFIPLCHSTKQTVFGFDAFEGLEDGGRWRGNMFFQDQFRYDGYITFKCPSNGKITKGWFKDTLPNFDYGHKQARFINLDCDNYEASKYVLNHLKPYIVSGTVISLDDYFCAYNFLENSQFTAWREFVKENNIEYDYIYCAAPAVVVKVK